MRVGKKTFVIILLLILGGFSIYPQFHCLETKHLRLIYFGDAHSYLVPHVARCFENSLAFHIKLFDYKPREKVTILLHDFSDFSNAGADAIPRNHITLAIAPNSFVFETLPSNERINATLNHELVHIVAIDQASKTDKFYRSIFFGKVSSTTDNPLSLLYSYLTMPRRYSPRWYHEGIAVFLETWMAEGLGRALGAYDEMVFRTMIVEGKTPYDLVSLESAGTKVDFHVGVNAYLYGTRFFSYLAHQYGPESLIKWVSRKNKTKAYFASQFRRVYGLSMHKAWSQWIEWEKEFQLANLSRLRSNPITAYQDISPKALGSVSRAFYDSTAGKIYTAVNYPGQVAHIAAIDVKSGRKKKICNIKGPVLFYVTSLAYDPENKILFYTTDNSEWRDLNKVDLKTGKTKRLLKEERIGDLTFNSVDRSLWGVRHFNGLSTIVRIPHPYQEWNQVFSWPYGKDVYDIDISPDGKLLIAALTDVSGNQKLIKMEVEKLLSGDSSYETLSDFENSSPANFTFSPDGRYLYGSSYRSGVSNIYSYDLEGKEPFIITNGETGFFRPVPISEDSLLVFRYTAKGFIPAIISNQPIDKVRAIEFLGHKIATKHPLVKDWSAGSPAAIDIESATVSRKDYKPFANIKLKSAYPIVEGYKDSAAYGLRLDLADSIPLQKLDLTLSYSPEESLPQKEKFHLKLNFLISNFKFTYAHNNANFYDLFGPTKTSMKGDSFKLIYKKNLIFDEPSRYMDFNINLAAYLGLERLPDYQNIAATFDKLFLLSFNYNYKYMLGSLGAVDYEKGFKWQTFLANYYVNNVLYPRLYTNFDVGFPFLFNHSSIWLRSSLGYCWGKREDPFANFYFGGFGNNWIDHLSYRRYRDFYSFPGVELNDIGGKNYAKLLLEWTLPPILFKRLGFPFFYANWASVSLFSSGIITNIDADEFSRKLVNVGLQINFRFIVLSHHHITFSVGHAVAFEKNRDNSYEWIFSLKIF